jgi:hypothetical protein
MNELGVVVSGLPITDFTTGATYNGQGRLIDFANG